MLAIRQIIGCSITDASDSGARAKAVLLAVDNCLDGREMTPLTLPSGQCQTPLRPGNIDKMTADIFRLYL